MKQEVLGRPKSEEAGATEAKRLMKPRAQRRGRASDPRCPEQAQLHMAVQAHVSLQKGVSLEVPERRRHPCPRGSVMRSAGQTRQKEGSQIYN